jgi:hypothetical protein
MSGTPSIPADLWAKTPPGVAGGAELGRASELVAHASAEGQRRVDLLEQPGAAEARRRPNWN